MRSYLVIGTGPSAAGATLALVEAGHEVTVVDLGSELEPERREIVTQLQRQPPQKWDAALVDRIREQPANQADGQLPQKRTYGSDYPFRNVGQLDGIRSVKGVNSEVVSSAYGGFSNVWGAQLMPYTAASIRDWPLSVSDLEPHYRAVLEEVPLAGAADDLAEDFPLLGTPQPLPDGAPRTQMVLRSYGRHRDRVRSHGVKVGNARLAFHSSRCERVGLCMTGCPFHLIYSAAYTFDKLRRLGKIKYLPGLLAFKLAEKESGKACVTVRAKDGKVETLEADRVFVGCGSIGTTRLVLGSLPQSFPSLSMAESVQIVLPFLSLRPTPDPRGQPGYTLNQFNMAVEIPGSGGDVAHVHCYPYNPAYQGALPRPFRKGPLGFVGVQALRHVTAGLAYLPSWAAPRVAVNVTNAPADALPELTLSGTGAVSKEVMKGFMRSLMKAGLSIDLMPFMLAGSISGPAKSYHVGGSFPLSREPGPGPRSDMLGRPGPWQRIHLVDGSVFPSVPATTFSFTAMANAHRIAEQASALDADA